MEIRDLAVFRTTNLLLGIYSWLGLFIVLVSHGMFSELYAPMLGERSGVGIAGGALSGIISGLLTFLSIFLVSKAAIKWKTKIPGTPGVAMGLLNMSQLFTIGAITCYITPHAFNWVTLLILFIISTVVGVSTCAMLYDWRLSDLYDDDLKLQDLKFFHADTLQVTNLITWASMIFMTGAVVAGLTQYLQSYPAGSAKADVASQVIFLFLFQMVFVGIGIWWGWLSPHLDRLEQIRLELRKIEKRRQQKRELRD